MDLFVFQVTVPPDSTQATFQSLLDAPGALVAAGIVTGFVKVLKRVFAALANFETRLLFFFTFLLYLITAVVVKPADANGYLGVFLAWLASATSALGIDEGQAKLSNQPPAPPAV